MLNTEKNWHTNHSNASNTAYHSFKAHGGLEPSHVSGLKSQANNINVPRYRGTPASFHDNFT